MLKMKVKIVDTLSFGAFHEQFNSSVLLMGVTIFNSVEYVCSKSSKDNIKKVFSKYNYQESLANVSFDTINVVDNQSAFGGLLRYLLSTILNIWMLFITSRKTRLVYTNNNPLSLWAINLLNSFLKRNVLIFCHGELELLVQSPSWYKPSSFYKFFIKTLFKNLKINSGIKFCVLGDSILNNLQPFLSNANRLNFITIEHPYFFAEAEIEKKVHTVPLKIGTVGVLTTLKGLPDFLELASNLKDKIQFSVVGRVMGLIDFEKYSFINFLVKGSEFLPREEYEREIKQLDYILFLYNTDSYKFTASGAIFDAIDYKKPIISLHNDYFEHVLKYPIGYMFDSLDDMKNELSCLADVINKDEYTVFEENILKLRAYYRPENIARILEKQL